MCDKIAQLEFIDRVVQVPVLGQAPVRQPGCADVPQLNFSSMVEGLRRLSKADPFVHDDCDFSVPSGGGLAAGFSGIFFSLQPLLRRPFLQEVRTFFLQVSRGCGAGVTRARYSLLVGGLEYVYNLLEAEGL